MSIIDDLKDSYRVAAEFIRQNDDFLITAHQGADGDAYGAALATAAILKKLNKKCRVIMPDDEADVKYAFMPGWDTVSPWSADIQQSFQSAIAVDVSSRKRIGGPAELLPERSRILKIDHHPFEEDFAGCTVETTEVSSASLLVYRLAAILEIELDLDMATCLYAGIVYDNGNFMNANTRAEDFSVAAEMMKIGIKPQDIANALHFSNTLPTLKAVGAGLKDMELWLDGQVGWIFLPQEIVAQQPKPDTEALANYSVSVRGCQIGVFARQAEENFIKVSLRSRGSADVSRIARFFGGGGHRQAAGCSFSGSVEAFRQALQPQLIECLNSVIGHADKLQ